VIYPILYKRRKDMGLSEKAREYLANRRQTFESERYLPRDARKPDDFFLRGYSLREYVSGKEKDKENLEILKKW
jgi:hypothetical protein